MSWLKSIGSCLAFSAVVILGHENWLLFTNDPNWLINFTDLASELWKVAVYCMHKL